MGYSGSIFANWGRRGSQIGLSAPTECTFAYVQHQRVGTGMQRRGGKTDGLSQDSQKTVWLETSGHSQKHMHSGNV